MNYIIVTNTFKRDRRLVERSLRASLSQHIKPLNVILIDQNPAELELPEDITGNALFIRQRTSNRSVSAARNTLKVPDEAEWIFFCDDDGYPDADYSVKLKSIIDSNPGIEILAGSIIREDTGEFYSLRHLKGGSLNKFRYSKNLMGSNFVTKKSVFDELERFDERFGVGSYWGSSEETDFCWKAYFAGKKMEFFPELKVFHVPPFNEDLKTGTKKAYLYGVGKGALVNKWLFKKKEPKVVFELGEMIIIPFVQSIRSIFILKPQLIITNMAALAGRLKGFTKAFFVGK